MSSIKKKELLDAVRELQPATAVAIAERLGVTPAAIRARLTRAHGAGELTAESVPGSSSVVWRVQS